MIISFDRRLTKKEEKKFLEELMKGVDRKEVVSVAAFDGENMVGHCDVRKRKARDLRHSGILGIVILDGYRGFGIGEKLIGEALRGASRIGVWLVELTVFAINERGIRLYEKIGFHKVGVVPDKILRDGRHLDEIVMFTDLREKR